MNLFWQLTVGPGDDVVLELFRINSGLTNNAMLHCAGGAVYLVGVATFQMVPLG